MKKLTLFIALIFAAALFAGPAAAADLKIGYANLQRALNECQAGIKAKEKLQEEAKKLEGELQAEQEELKKLKEEIDKKSAVWNAETKEAKQNDFRTRSQSFQQKFMEYGEELNKKKQQTESQIIKELQDVVQELAEKNKYSYVFERSIGGLLYAPDDADLTDEVIKAYDKKFKASGK